MITGENIILFSSDDWSSGLKSSKYHIAIRLAKDNRVLFINSIGLRNPTMNTNDLKRIFNKLKAFCKGYEAINKNLYVFTPIVIPFHKFKYINMLNSLLLIICLKCIKFLLKFSRPILIIFIPNVSQVVGRLKEKCTVYYCIDELKGYKDVNKTMFEKMEGNLLTKSNCIITCSKKLCDLKRKSNSHTYYVPHGVDWCLFRKAVDNNLEIPLDVAFLRKPIIGFYGFISEDWIDFNLLNYVANKHPEWTIVLIGRSKLVLSKEIKTENIHFLGVKNYEDLPRYNRAFDVAIIPFKINELTLSSNPLKLFEYLSSGKPVVSVDIPEVSQYRDLVRIANSYENFEKNIEEALNDNSKELQLRRSDRMKNETWENRLEKISEIIKEHCK